MGSDFDAASEAWAQYEEQWYADRQKQTDRMRVRGYAIACLKLAEQASKDMEKAGRALERARKAAERAQKRMTEALEEAERITRVFVADDPEWTEEVARCLEECFG